MDSKIVLVILIILIEIFVIIQFSLKNYAIKDYARFNSSFTTLKSSKFE